MHFPDAVERKRYCEMIGNYALLTARINGKANNRDFQAKRREIFKVANVGMFPLTGNLVSFESWTKHDIETRHGAMLEMLEQVLQFQLR
jgi:hypothetical protein